MPLSIKDPEADHLARVVAGETGETITQAVISSLRERLERIKHEGDDIEDLVEEVLAIGKHCASLPVLDNRSADEVLGYDASGLPS